MRRHLRRSALRGCSRIGEGNGGDGDSAAGQACRGAAAWAVYRLTIHLSVTGKVKIAVGRRRGGMAEKIWHVRVANAARRNSIGRPACAGMYPPNQPRAKNEDGHMRAENNMAYLLWRYPAYRGAPRGGKAAGTGGQTPELRILPGEYFRGSTGNGSGRRWAWANADGNAACASLSRAAICGEKAAQNWRMK